MKHIAIYNPNLHTMGGGEKVCLALAEVLAKHAKVTLLTHKKTDLAELESYFGVDLKNVSVRVVPVSKVLRKIHSNRHVPDAFSRLIRDFELYKKFKAMHFDVFINNAYNTELPSPASVGVYMCMFPHKILDVRSMSLPKRLYLLTVRGLAKLLMHPTKQGWLDTYELITANSLFTRKYIQEYWGRSSEVLYPICDAIEGEEEKRKIILNVGRFFHNNGITHHKRQDFLIDSFVGMDELHKQGWELHLAGTINENYHDMAYVVDLLQRSDGYPVFFHFGVPLKRLQQLYRQASIYWHATGYGVDSSKFPERQEHFGISTVEAMSAGAVPVVINTAGQREVVTDGEDGYLWDGKRQLYAKTFAAIQHTKALSDRARQTAQKYDRHSFAVQCKRIFGDMI